MIFLSLLIKVDDSVAEFNHQEALSLLPLLLFRSTSAVL